MSTIDMWLIDNYNEVMKKYSGKYVLIADNKIVFSDDSFDPVYDKFMELKNIKECKISLIDDGEASFYAIKLSNYENKT